MSVLWNGGGVKRLSTAILGLSALAILTAWAGSRSSSPDAPRDFEECAERAQNASGAERNAQATECGARFAGRRKAGGGYTYFDFMQNRTFDIAGPNPTVEERRYIDSEYMRFLDSERSDALSAELAQRQAEKLVAGFESTLTVGAPIILLPKNPPSKPPIINRTKHCKMEGSLSCSWAKLKSAVRDAFASATKPVSD
jgi:hypothetical protein